MANKSRMLDPVIHEPARLTIITILRYVEAAEFPFLLRETGLTNGNLVSHMRRMEMAGYVSVTKTFKGRRPCTTYRLTPLGVKRYDEYRAAVRSLVNRARSLMRRTGSSSGSTHPSIEAVH